MIDLLKGNSSENPKRAKKIPQTDEYENQNKIAVRTNQVYMMF